MSSFAAEWLALREPADRSARDRGLAARLAAWLAGQPAPATILDLGSGTGATVRALSDIVPPDAHWHLVDNDPALLATAQSSLGTADTIETVDLALDLDIVARIAPDVVTASALIDLVSDDWIYRLTDVADTAGAAVYCALTCDGNDKWSPPHPADAFVHRAFLADMRRDKGFGPALGVDAAPVLAESLAKAGYRVASAASPWRLGAGDEPLIGALADGVADTVVGHLDDTATVDAWRLSRRQATAVAIGHVDVLGLPPG